MIKNSLFYCKNKDTYPPFKNGLYLEEYFLKMFINNKPTLSRKYIPALWTNFQIESWFIDKKNEMQNSLNEWIKENPSENGYFTIVQYDDGPLLTLPSNTIIYGACAGDIPIPLIYEDINNTLINIPKKSFTDKKILSSFVGSITGNHVQPSVRNVLINYFKNNINFVMNYSGDWTPIVNKINQNKFIDITLHSKFALAPRGYGRSSFRFFECFQLGTIPIYVWNDINWLPFKEIINYDKLCIHIHISEINHLEKKLLLINEEQYNSMLNYYNEIKSLFELEGMSNQIIELNK